MADSSYSTSTSTSGSAQLAQLAEQLMQQQYAWGQSQFAQNSQLTDQVVGDLMNVYGSLSGVGSTLMSEYNNYFTPEYQNLVQDANNYSSTARIQQAMGAAESGVSQNFNGQRNAALADLQSFGIDPSSGRYAQLDSAERTQQAAAQAGAGFQAEQATEATGRGLRSEALQLGSVMPSQATAAYNAAQGAATAGENAKLANSQEGVNMMGSPTQYGQIAGGYRTANSQSASGGYHSPNSGKGNNGPTANPNYHPDPTLNEHETSAQSDPNWAGSGGGGGTSQGGMNMQQPSAGIQGANGGPGVVDAGGQPGPTDPGGQPWDSGASPTPSWQDPTQNQDPWGQGVSDGQPWNSGSSGSGTDNGVLPSGSGLENMGTQNPGAGASDPWSNGSPDSWTMQPADNQPTQDTSAANDTSGSGGDGIDYSSMDTSGGDQSAATGGLLSKTKGAIPYSRSPSHGAVTDDVPAKLNDTGEDIRLNAGEFVIPRHAVSWHGEKKFQDMIRQAHHGRAAAPAKPTMKPPLPAIPTERTHARSH